MEPGRVSRLGDPGQPGDAGDNDVAHAAVGQLSADLGPKPRALTGLDPRPQHVFGAVDLHAHGSMRGSIAGRDSVVDLDHQAIERAVLRGEDSSSTVSGDVRDPLSGQLGADRGRLVVLKLEVADRHLPRIQALDNLIHVTQGLCTLSHPA